MKMPSERHMRRTLPTKQPRQSRSSVKKTKRRLTIEKPMTSSI